MSLIEKILTVFKPNAPSEDKLSQGLNEWFDSIEGKKPEKEKSILLKAEMSTRKNYEQSCGYLQSTGYLREGEIPKLPNFKPRYDDTDLGFSFFRYMCEGVDFSNLTLPRTFFGKSELDNCSFLNTDLSESVLCWNDFVCVDFSHADLSKADLRASDFDECNFQGSNLSKADLRLSDYRKCNFQDALMIGALLSKDMKDELKLSDKQTAEIDWQDDSGDEPDGG